MRWFLGMTGDTLNRADNYDFKDMIRVAINSASVNAPRLEPNLIFDGPPCSFTLGLRALGVKVHYHRISFYDQLKHAQEKRFPNHSHYMMTACGAFLRLEIPKLCDDEFALYTDVDVMWQGVGAVEQFKPHTFLAAPQFDLNGHKQRELNSGVMVLNLARLNRDLPAILDFGCDVADFTRGYDQQFLDVFYRGSWDPLPPKYNWKPYWGRNQDAKIVHWHGPKPSFAKKMMADADQNGSKDWRDLFNRDPAAYQHYLAEWEKFK